MFNSEWDKEKKMYSFLSFFRTETQKYAPCMYMIRLRVLSFSLLTQQQVNEKMLLFSPYIER